LRIVALSSDAYTRLDWSAALLTDEGFYSHNARNVALFGHPRTDDFNNMLLAPVLHAVQVGVFSIFGVGMVQARSISVVCSLLTLLLLWSALRRAFDERVAVTAVLFLALDHTNLLYNRLALLDTPASLPAAAAFYAFVRGIQSTGGNPKSEIRNPKWLLLCGLLLGLTVTNRMLAAYLLPVPFIALWIVKEKRGSMLALTTGLAVVAAIYLIGWYWPHHTEMAAMNRYYRTNQIQPRSIGHLLENIQHAIAGDFRGLSPYLFRHTPVVYFLALGGIVAAVGRWAVGRWLGGRRSSELISPVSPISAIGPGETQRAAAAYLTAWFLLGAAMLAVISYSPSRYYVTLYPAMASLAAVALWRIPAWLQNAKASHRWIRLGVSALAAFALFHFVLAVVHYRGVLPPTVSNLWLYGLPLLLGGMVLWRWERGCDWLSVRKAHAVPLLLAVWLAFNGGWLIDWTSRVEYTQVHLSRWLGENLPAGSVLIGDVAPGITMENRFPAIHVQPGLANDRQPVERFAGAPRYVVILDGRWKEPYWLKNYPALVAPERRVKVARVLRWDVGIYAVDTPTKRTP
jgi:4-amino-4-deoxy-L-arabinose transferase-like glycosyltransferase